MEYGYKERKERYNYIIKKMTADNKSRTCGHQKQNLPSEV